MGTLGLRAGPPAPDVRAMTFAVGRFAGKDAKQYEPGRPDATDPGSVSRRRPLTGASVPDEPAVKHSQDQRSAQCPRQSPADEGVPGRRPPAYGRAVPAG